MDYWQRAYQPLIYTLVGETRWNEFSIVGSELNSDSPLSIHPGPSSIFDHLAYLNRNSFPVRLLQGPANKGAFVRLE